MNLFKIVNLIKAKINEIEPHQVVFGYKVFNVEGTAESSSSPYAEAFKFPVPQSANFYLYESANSDVDINDMIKMASFTQITYANKLFWNCAATEIDISGKNFENCEQMPEMFRNCNNLVSLNVSGINIPKVIGMNYFASNCGNLKSVDFSGVTGVIGTESYTGHGIDNMFSDDSNLESVDFTNSDIKLHSMTSAFYGCSKLQTLDLSNLTVVGERFSLMLAFSGCTALTNLTLPKIGENVTIGVLGSAFSNCPNLSNESLNGILNFCSKITNSSSSLKDIGLSQTQAETCTTLSNWAAASANGWTTGY